MFDADLREQALERPRVKIKGRTYTGRLLNVWEWEPYKQRLQAFMDDAETTITDEAFTRLAEDYLREVFRRPWWQVWKPRGRTIVNRIFRLPGHILSELILDFFGCQGRAHSLAMIPPPSGMSGKPTSRHLRAIG